MTSRIRLSIVTGFLGSGKTTLINALLPMPELANSAVMVNEFGQIDIDSDLIESERGDVMQLTSGCVCCELSDELAPALVEFAEKRVAQNRPVDRVILETTGLANAGPIVEVLLEHPDVRRLYELDKVITTVDAVHGDTNLNLHAESVEQVAVADRILLTKLDLFDEAEQPALIARLSGRLRRLNPNAVILTGDRAGVLRDDDDGAVRRIPDEAQESPGFADKGEARHDHHIKSFCLTSDKPTTQAFLDRFCRRLSKEAGPNLLRVKGLVCVAERPETPAVVQGVQQVFDTMRWLDRWPSDDRRTRIVIIGWMLDQAGIERLFEGKS